MAGAEFRLGPSSISDTARIEGPVVEEWHRVMTTSISVCIKIFVYDGTSTRRGGNTCTAADQHLR